MFRLLVHINLFCDLSDYVMSARARHCNIFNSHPLSGSIENSDLAGGCPSPSSKYQHTCCCGSGCCFSGCRQVIPLGFTKADIVTIDLGHKSDVTILPFNFLPGYHLVTIIVCCDYYALFPRWSPSNIHDPQFCRWATPPEGCLVNVIPAAEWKYGLHHSGDMLYLAVFK